MYIKWKSERKEDYVDLVSTNISNVINPKVSLAASSNTLENPLTKLSISDCSTFSGLIVSKTFITLLIFVETKST
jgi:hypothetical protein